MSGPISRRLAILIVGSDDPVCLSLVRALGRAGHRVTLVRTAERELSVESSRYCADCLVIDAARLGARDALAGLVGLLGERRFDVLIPADEIALEIVYSGIESIETLTRVVGPPAEARKLASNFMTALPLAVAAGFDAPTFEVVKPGETFSHTMPPCTVMPVTGCAIIDDEPQTFKRRIVRSAEELDSKLRDDLPRTDVVILKATGGRRLSLDLCAFEGRLLGATACVHLHQPRRGGASTYFDIGPVDPNHLAMLAAMVQRLGWSGFMSIDFEELNGRLLFLGMNAWPTLSIGLANRAGVDMARLLADAFDGAAVTDVVMPAKRRYVRDIGRDLRWMIREARGGAGTGAVVAWIASLGHVLRGQEKVGVIWLLDPGPMLAAAHRLSRSGARRIASGVMRGLDSAEKGSAPPIDLAPSSALLIVCQGNINRSFVAEQLLRARGFSLVQSAGLLPVSGRRPSRFAEAFVEKALGSIAPAFRSASLDRRLRENPDRELIVCFERWQIDAIVERFPSIGLRIVLLSELALEQGQDADIPDPHGDKSEAYRTCFERIDRLVTMIAARTTEQRPIVR